MPFGADDVAFAFADVGVSAVVHATTETTGMLRTEREYEQVGSSMMAVEKPSLFVQSGKLADLQVDDELTVDGVRYLARSTPTPQADGLYDRVRLVRA